MTAKKMEINITLLEQTQSESNASFSLLLHDYFFCSPQAGLCAIAFELRVTRCSDITLSGGIPLRDIEGAHGLKIEWSDVRVCIDTVEKSTAIVTSSSRSLHGRQGAESSIDRNFDQIFAFLNDSNIDATREAVRALQAALKVKSGFEVRANIGGLKYSAIHALNSVLLSDSLVDPGLLDSAVRQSISISVQPELKDHILLQGLQLPSRSVIYRYTVDLEFCSILWARDFFWVPDMDWVLHFRTDSSPQFARNYLVAECDRVTMTDISPGSYEAVFVDIEIVPRLMPLQILGKRATDTNFKYASSSRMFALESHDPNLLKERTRTTLFDFGVEFQLSILETTAGCRVFPSSLPLCDMDHGLHHVTMVIFSTFDSTVWDPFDRHVCTLAKFFSKRDCCDYFTKHCIWNNPKIESPALKRSLAVMFDQTCPFYYKERWGFYFEVLQWLALRIDALDHLNVSILNAENQLAITEAEAESFKREFHDPTFRHTFRAMLYTVFFLLSWSKYVSDWFHWCPCCPRDSKKRCQWRGRRLIECANGAVDLHLDKLHQLAIGNASSQASVRAHSALEAQDAHSPALAQLVRQGFANTKAGFALRYKQAASFLGEGPWRTLAVLEFVLPGKHSQQEMIDTCKERARQLQGLFADAVSKLCLPQNYLGAWQRWAEGVRTASGCDMDTSLFKLLVGYGSALLVMKRLEAKHHLVNIRASRARATSSLGISAKLRRTLNTDIHQESFEANLATYMGMYHTLVPETWSSRSELCKYVSGHHLEIMFASHTSASLGLVSAQPGPGPSFARASRGPLLNQLSHLETTLTPYSYYAVPRGTDDLGTTYQIFQLLSFRPGLKRYIQRVVGWSKDFWCDKLAILACGDHQLKHAAIQCDIDQVVPRQPTPTDTFTVLPQSQCIAPLEVAALFDAKGVPLPVFRFEDVAQTNVLTSSIYDHFQESAMLDIRAEQRILELGDKAAKSGTPLQITNSDKPHAEWLVDQELATMNAALLVDLAS
jgi:hypothetical protein